MTSVERHGMMENFTIKYRILDEIEGQSLAEYRNVNGLFEVIVGEHAYGFYTDDDLSPHWSGDWVTVWFRTFLWAALAMKDGTAVYLSDIESPVKRFRFERCAGEVFINLVDLPHQRDGDFPVLVDSPRAGSDLPVTYCTVEGAMQNWAEDVILPWEVFAGEILRAAGDFVAEIVRRNPVLGESAVITELRRYMTRLGAEV